MTELSKCPFNHGSAPMPVAGRGPSPRDWWPQQINLAILHQHSPASNPLGEAFDYAEAFETLDYHALKRDLIALMTDSQEWWPADWGHYGGLFIRMAWHSAGTYRISDGRGGANGERILLAPQKDWEANQPAQLAKVLAALEDVQKAFGKKVSLADLIVLGGRA